VTLGCSNACSDVSDRFDQQKFVAARLSAASRYPFLSVALYALTPCAAPGLGTFAVDERWRVFIDPVALDGWTVAEVAGALAHEVSHLVRFHAARARAHLVDESRRVTWNLAADAELNDDLLTDGFVLPSPVTPATLGLPPGKAAEYYFDKMIEANTSAESLPGYFGAPNCGEGAHGVAGIVPSMTGCEGQAGLPGGVTEAEAALLRRAVAEQLWSGQWGGGLGGQLAGRGGGGWSRWAEQQRSTVIDWRRVLGARIRGSLSGARVGRTDYRYQRPARRRVPRVILPSLVQPAPRLAVVVDTSGSVSERALSLAWSEVVGILRSQGLRREQLSVWATDMTARRVTIRDVGRVELHGGGGTDMGVGIEAALTARPMPDVVLVMTDGETPWPPEPPAKPVIVCLFRRTSSRSVVAPAWARVVDVPLDELDV
jgi:predicted metal-dependent peptidase